MKHIIKRPALTALTLFALLFCAAFSAVAGNTWETAAPLPETLLHSFSNTGDGAYPGGGMILGSDGNFYGTTCGTAFDGGGPGATSYGTVFKMTPDGTLTTVYTFGGAADGNCPDWELVEGPDGNFYGMTKGGNGTTPYGTIFVVTPAGSLTTLYAFCGSSSCIVSSAPKSPGFVGQQPALTLGSDGNFYGTSYAFGVSGCGAIFKMTPAGALTIVYAFTCGADGGSPEPGLVLGTDGNFYGTAKTSAASTAVIEVGEVFKLTPSGTLSVLYQFCSSAGCDSDYGQPVGAPVLAPDNNLYGVANFVSGAGVFYEVVTSSGTVNILPIAAGPNFDWTMRLAGEDGNIYGGGGDYVFQYTPGGGIFYWNGGVNSNQYGALIGLVQDEQGNFYGQSTQGGSSLVGAIFTATLAAPGVTLTASPTTITLGQSSTLTWSSTDETSCTAGGAWSGSESTSGTQVVTPIATGTTSFTLTCTGASGSANASVTVSVQAPLPTVNISVTPTSITLGQSATLNWSSTNATSCTASNGWSGAQATSGTQSVTPAQIGTSNYTLTCNGAGGGLVATAILTVTNSPSPTVNISVIPTSITLGQSATLNWSSTNATSCAASNGWSGAQNTSGTTMVTPSAAGTATYTLTCNGLGGGLVATAALLVTNPPPPAVNISVTPTSITLGQSATLNWSSTNATSCMASNGWSGAQNTGGTTMVTPSAAGTATYTLSCSGAAGASTDSAASLTVNAPAASGGGGSVGLGTVLVLALLVQLHQYRRRYSVKIAG